MVRSIIPAPNTSDRWVQNVRNFVNGKRAAGTAAQTTATATGGNATITLASAASWEAGHGGALIGGGTAHGMAAPTNCFAIPKTAYGATLSGPSNPIPLTTAFASSNRIQSSGGPSTSGRFRLLIPDGQGVRFDTQGGSLPSYTGPTAFLADTTYYLRNAPMVATYAMTGTPTGGTYRLVEEWTGNGVDVPYNATWEIQTIAVSGTPTGGTYTITVTGFGTTAALAHNADSTAVQAALRLLAGLERVVVNQSGSTPNFTHTIHFNGVQSNISQATSTSSLTGGTPVITHATVANWSATTSFESLIRTLPGYGQVQVDQTGTLPNLTHTVTHVGVPGNTYLINDLTSLTGGTPVLTRGTTTAGGWTIHPTAADAIANTNAYTLVADASSAFMTVYGSRTYEYQVAALTGNGGVTAASSTFQTTLGPHELSRFTHMMICCDKPTNAKGLAIYGDGTSNKKLLMVCNGNYNPMFRVNLQAGGFTAWKWSDIGKTVSDGTNTGTLMCFDEASRNMWVRATTFGSNGATITTSGGTGGGTQTGASVAAFVYQDWGNDKDDNLGTSWDYGKYMWYPRIQRRCNEQIYPGQLMETGGNLYICSKVFPGPNENGPLDRKTLHPMAFTINTSTNVITLSSAYSIATGTGLYLASTVALPTHTATTRFQENTLVYLRQLTTSTYTLHPTALDATNNTNVYDLIADGLGTHYVLLSPSFSTTLNAYTRDDRVQWRRENASYPVTPPASAIEDLHLFTVVSKSGNDLVISAAPTTSVTSQLILHDDTDALLAHFNVIKSSSAKSFKMFFPLGDYPIVSRKTLDETRWFVSAFGGGNSRTLFRWFDASTQHLDCEWESEPGTRVIWQAMDCNGDAPSGSSPVSKLHGFAFCNAVFRNIEWCHYPKGVPVCEDAGGVNYDDIFNYDVDSTAGGGDLNGPRIIGPKFYGGGFYGWANLGGVSWINSEATAEVYEDFVAYYGASNHDAGFYTNGGFFNRVQCFGIRAERSQMFYQDYDDGVPLRITNCRFEGAMKDGIAARRHDFLIENCILIDCLKIFSRENLNGFTVRNCKLVETDIYPHNQPNNWSQNVTIDNVQMVNCTIGLDPGNTNVFIDNVRTRFAGKIPRYTLAYGPGTLTGTGQIVRNWIHDNRNMDGIYDLRGINLGGNGVSQFENIRVVSSRGAWGTFSTSGTGPKTIKDCYFWTANGAGQACLTQHTGEAKWINNRFAGRASNSDYPISTGGRSDFENNTSETGTTVTFANTITGPTYIRKNQWLGTSVTYAEPSLVIEDNNHAAAPSITGATQSTSGNRVADSLVASPGTLASGVTNNYALGIQNIHRLTPNGAGSTLGGIVARADGNIERLINVHASASVILDDDAAGSTSSNRYAFAALTIPAGGIVDIAYDTTAALWALVSKNF